jgi:CBS domain-containing protein
MTESRKVGDAMTPNPVSISEAASLAEAVGLLNSNKISGMPVVDPSGELVGVLSQTDLIKAQANPQLQANWRGLAVGQIMTKPALTIPSTATLEQAARLMAERRVHRLVVTDATATPIGVISASDLVRSWLG